MITEKKYLKALQIVLEYEKQTKIIEKCSCEPIKVKRFIDWNDLKTGKSEITQPWC
jgi:hypothetical protein